MKGLRAFEKMYHFFVGSKNFLYDKNYLKPLKLKFPVVSVGNLSFGGTGKTPFIILLAEEFSSGYKINIVTRSYKARLREPRRVNLQEPDAATLYGDEACLIQETLPGCSVWSGPSKAATAIASAISQPDLILLDDGFSHRKLWRNFDLILVDATEGLSNYLRESVRNLKRASAVVITKANLADAATIAALEAEIISVALHLKNCIFISEIKTSLRVSQTEPLFVFCGIAKPESFVDDLVKQGYKVAASRFFADHYMYSVSDQQEILKSYSRLKKEYKNLRLVTTEKDLVKISENSLRVLLDVPTHRITMKSDHKEVLLEKIRQSL